MPTLVDDGFVVTESRPIATYLCSVHGGEAGEKLYPKDPKVRAIVDARLFFDIGTFYKAFGDVVVSWKFIHPMLQQLLFTKKTGRQFQFRTTIYVLYKGLILSSAPI